jgi:hypothetical protein
LIIHLDSKIADRAGEALWHLLGRADWLVLEASGNQSSFIDAGSAV